jgi:hypothetical protein
MATARSTLRGYVATAVRDVFVTGTATGGSTTTIVDSARTEGDDEYNNWWAYILTTTDTLAPQGQERKISAYSTSSDTATVPIPYTAAVQANDTYEFHEGYRVAEYNEAINHAIRQAKGKIFTKTISTATTVSNQYRYTMSTATTEWNVSRVEVQWDTTVTTYPYLQSIKWRLEEDAGTYYLQFSEALPGSYTLRIHHITDPSELSTDSATTSVPTDYIVEAAKVYLFEMRASEGTEVDEKRAWITLADRTQPKAERLLARYAKQFPATVAKTIKYRTGQDSWHDDVYVFEGLDDSGAGF